MKIIMLGTGNALVTECYNTCFVLEDNHELFLVDGGGGNNILRQIKKAGYQWQDIRHIFVTHKHIDHIMGVVWMVRMITQHMSQGKYDGEAFVYGHDEVIRLIRDMAVGLLQEQQTRFLDSRLHLMELQDGDEFTVIGNRCIAFDIGSTKAKQFGFTMYYRDNRKLTCCGDEPYNDREYLYAVNSDWLLHEAFCLAGEADIFRPYEKHHSTVKDACELAQKLNVKNILLYHTEDKNIANRKRLYLSEGEQFFTGGIEIPEDLEVICT